MSDVEELVVCESEVSDVDHSAILQVILQVTPEKLKELADLVAAEEIVGRAQLYE